MPDQKKSILLVEDANFFARITESELERAGNYHVTTVKTYAQAKETLNDGTFKPFLALVDLTLPDAPDGEVVDLTVDAELPTIVFSGRFDQATRRSILKKGIVDYVLKDSPASLAYLSELVRRVDRNLNTKVLIVDDSCHTLALLKKRLRLYCLQVVTATTGEQALEILHQNPDIKLLIIDHLLPGATGFDIMMSIRRTRSFNTLAIIGISATEDPALTAKFLKSGANDFLNKACTPEELMLRVSQNLNQLDRITELTEMAHRDPMTGLFNRRHLYNHVDQLHQYQIKAGKEMRYAMIDIDRFKQINDRFGHEAGDNLIISVAHRILDLLPPNSIAVRIGGDEFCVALPDIDEPTAKQFLSELRSSMPIADPGNNQHTFAPTISVGLSEGTENTLADALRVADRCLYRAKKSGRNRIVVSSDLVHDLVQ
ncbi:Response regulator PleD [Pseudovibrio axinellae]|uniref:diguanylate cyclase n=1 Tax=Pseudovibrio axinellae TaxID=989403 RepID=A0A161X9V8_9HYPH|nr:diguanylate cyclase [Pseudovibrio axinellae]KZL09478.1 Response regulator PleD [Pseudovibrio axinellae]SEQ63608.1 response regulator receiver modulated diguanylate cyclase [Pseudovibrio axinellae]